MMGRRSNRFRLVRGRSLAGVQKASAAFLCAMLGCNLPPAAKTASRDLPARLDRLVAAYEDLASKRFEIVADFESPDQGTIFHVEPPNSGASAGVSADRARTETGVGSLKMTLVESQQRVVAYDVPDAHWSLVRDWSRYHMLLMSVFSPRKLAGFSVTVRSGTTASLSYALPRIFLNPGWNLVRIDLGDLLEQVNLADVRELEFGCDPLESPVDLYLDDLVLADNSREVFGSSQGQPGQLYVRTEGRRLVVGSVGRFEVVFSRGQIRQWYDTAHDTARLHNLVGRGNLGPIPLALSGDPNHVALDDPSQWAGLGIGAEMHQALLEATPFMARVQGDLRFATVDAPPDEASPYHRWIYTIYPDGRIYVECTGTARKNSFNPAGIAMAFACDSGAGFKRQVAQARPADSQPAGMTAAPSYALFTREPRNAADLLIVPSAPLPARSIDNPQDGRTGVLWALPDTQAAFGFAALIRLWPSDIDSPVQAAPIAADYQQPLPIGLEVGRLGRTDPGDLDADGFSEARGYYVVQLDSGIARARIPGQSRMRFAPMFELVEAAGRDVWAYLDGRQIKQMQRDRDGNVLFLLPEVIAREALLEINSRPQENKPVAGGASK